MENIVIDASSGFKGAQSGEDAKPFANPKDYSVFLKVERKNRHYAGMGSLLSPNILLTAYHVVKDQEALYVDGYKVNILGQYHDKVNDIAILVLDRNFGIPPLTISNEHPEHWEEHVIASYRQENNRWEKDRLRYDSYYQPKLSAPFGSQKLSKKGYKFFSVHARGGYSGSPVINEQGQVVSIAAMVENLGEQNVVIGPTKDALKKAINAAFKKFRRKMPSLEFF